MILDKRVWLLGLLCLPRYNRNNLFCREALRADRFKQIGDFDKKHYTFTLGDRFFVIEGFLFIVKEKRRGIIKT